MEYCNFSPTEEKSTIKFILFTCTCTDKKNSLYQFQVYYTKKNYWAITTLYVYSIQCVPSTVYLFIFPISLNHTLIKSYHFLLYQQNKPTDFLVLKFALTPPKKKHLKKKNEYRILYFCYWPEIYIYNQWRIYNDSLWGHPLHPHSISHNSNQLSSQACNIKEFTKIYSIYDLRLAF